MRADQAASSSSQQNTGGMTRDEAIAFIERRQECFDDFNAAGLAADYADDAVIESPMSGRHTGPAAAEQAMRAVFEHFWISSGRPTPCWSMAIGSPIS